MSRQGKASLSSLSLGIRDTRECNERENKDKIEGDDTEAVKTPVRPLLCREKPCAASSLFSVGGSSCPSKVALPSLLHKADPRPGPFPHSRLVLAPHIALPPGPRLGQ